MLRACDRPEHVGDQPIVLVQAHDHPLRHGRVRTDPAPPAAPPRRPRSMKITCRPDSSSVSGPNIGMHRGHAAPGLDQRIEAGAQRRLQRARDRRSGRAAPRCASCFRISAVALSGVASTMRSESRGWSCQSASWSNPGRPPRGVGDGDLKSLRGQEIREPAAHLAVAADHQGALAGALALRRNTRLLLGGERGLDELPQQRFGQIGLDAQPLGAVAAAQNHLPLAREVARGPPGGALDGRHLLARAPAGARPAPAARHRARSARRAVRPNSSEPFDPHCHAFLLLPGTATAGSGTATILS